jgi:RNA polymerase I specific transcription initiation factor RRN3
VSQFLPVSESSGTGAGMPVMQLRLWVSALSHVVSQLERTHSALVEAVISMPWTTMDSIFVKSYISFVGMLVSARPEYLSLVLEKTARGFTFRTPPIHLTSLQLITVSRVWVACHSGQYAGRFVESFDPTCCVRQTSLPA